jgi:RND family efflux transporter MFP subunit
MHSLVAVRVVFALGAVVLTSCSPPSGDAAKTDRRRGPTPVEVTPIEIGTIAKERRFSGSLEPTSQFVVAPKVSGRISGLQVDVGDPVRRGQEVALLDDDEYQQAVAEAAANVAVVEANLAEAKSSLDNVRRELARTQTLHDRGVASESRLDTVQAEFLAAEAAVNVAEANLARQRASWRAAEIRLSYTRVTANWSAGDDERVVAERFVDEGATVAANTPLLSVVELDPALAVIQATEVDYPRLRIDQPARLETDAFPLAVFTGRVVRVAPIFRQASRQARVELMVDNPEGRLKPGMFVRVTLELDRAEDAAIVPALAVTRRRDRTGVFVVDEAGPTASWREVTVGIESGDRVQIQGDARSGRVITLGQQYIEDGSPIAIPADRDASSARAAPTL